MGTTPVTNPSVSQILGTSQQEASAGQVSAKVDTLYASMPAGRVNSIISDNFYGFNHRQQPGSMPINRDVHGLTFFTRPRLNFTTGNLRDNRLFAPLLRNSNQNQQRIIRCILDPELSKGTGGETINTPLVDEHQAFIPFLTNSLISMSGWPDMDAPIFTSHEGVYKESFSLIDGIVRNYTTYDISANFRNTLGDPITAMFFYWLHYASSVYLGEMVPYPDSLLQNEIDYNTRIYRLVMDPARRYVQKIAATIAFPRSNPMGAAFNFDAAHPLNQSNDQISINFQCMGAMYNDDILVYEFNRTQVMFNALMDDRHRESTLIKIPVDKTTFFNYRGYPRINPADYELEWWVDKNYYQSVIKTYGLTS